ncbi:class I adenylate-forming enzyme family protein [Tsukamurella pseudospumae]|uniref:Long-chain fatty acid--CoA ligase n=1 Tax=Tsukamurella pseudospumae TaxID=239498 RepID=A0A137ZXP4_9ACTN|nr:AMP-binding protein [Tsukamurella pseudospumae]KXO98340.1 long-chain fatty acid--CoA ligase [Tsukamurella pseudospumae]KXP02976.1 long-chain fatty acid--CoA ligase [Tsukamurella pseudospumae]
MAIIDYFDQGWARNAGGDAFVLGDRRWTYQEAGELTCRIAHALLGEKVALTGNAAVLSPNDPVGWMCVLGIWRAGRTWVPLHPGEPASTSAQLMRQFDCEALFFHSSMRTEAEELCAALPQVSLVICIDSDLDGAYTSLENWIDGAPSTRPTVPYDMDDVVMISPTGGTTGLPKGVMNTHRTLANTCAHLLMAFEYGDDEHVVNLAAAPLTHSAGIVTLPTMVRGGTVVIIERPDPASVVAAIEEHHVTDLFLPPTVIYRMLDWVAGRDCDFSSLRYFVHGAAPMSVEKLKRAIEVFGPVMMAAYGQTEAFAAIAYARPDERVKNGIMVPDSRLDSCGRPYPLISVEIRDRNDAAVSVGESGEICVRGDLVMKGYYKQPDKTAETIVDGWLHTGDVGHLDEDGYLYITDRTKDMIISGGFNVYPSEIEQVIWGHPAVADCAVIGVPDPDWGEKVIAVVELSPGQQVDGAELIALVKEALGSVRTPKRIDIVPSLPRSGTGKVLKRALREDYWSGADTKI